MTVPFGANAIRINLERNASARRVASIGKKSLIGGSVAKDDDTHS